MVKSSKHGASRNSRPRQPCSADPGRNGKIAFFANLTGSLQIYTINPDGTGLFQVTNLPPANDVFAFAPDFSSERQADYLSL